MGKKKNKQMNEVETNESHERTTNHDTVGSGRGDYPVQYPEQIGRDYITVMDDETLYNLGRSFSDSINRVARFNLNPYPWEVELCYVQQEIQLRSSRRNAHAVWLNNVSVTLEKN
jgi:hypothetical protein